MKMVLKAWVALSLVTAVVICVASFVVWKATRPKLQLKACFHSYSGLKPNAMVRVAGVEAGRVRRIKDGIGECPVDIEIELMLTKDFEHLPRNASARLETEGVLGPAYLEIDLPKVSGPAIENNGVPQTAEYTQGLSPEAAEKLKKIANDVIDKATARPVNTVPGAPEGR
jgi:ABC-type transporter Mla subunit MlaD